MSRTYRKIKGKKYQDKDSKNRKPAKSCLNYGGCPRCEGNRTHKFRKKMPDIEDAMEEME